MEIGLKFWYADGKSSGGLCLASEPRIVAEATHVLLPTKGGLEVKLGQSTVQPVLTVTHFKKVALIDI